MLLVALLVAQPDLEALAAAAAESRKRFEGGYATWTATHTLENGAAIEVRCARQGDRSRVLMKSHDAELGRLLARDGVWYVSDPSGDRQHRPYEAAFFLPTWTLYQAASEPVFLEDPAELRGLPFDGAADGVGTWRPPPDPAGHGEYEEPRPPPPRPRAPREGRRGLEGLATHLGCGFFRLYLRLRAILQPALNLSG